jgi:thiamine transport system permease protein
VNKILTGLFAPGLVLGAILFGLVPLLWFILQRGGGFSFVLETSTAQILYFTIKQALLSTILSVLIGGFAARAFARRQFWGRDFLFGLFTIPLALPAIVVVLSVSTVYGAQGWLGGFINIYGLSGILVAHIFFNAPLAARLFLEALHSVAPENFRLAEQMGFNDFATLRYVDGPALREVLPKVFSLIFLLCAASFIVVLTIGGPSATTLEVAIYQSLRQDFDVARAINLAFVQIALSIVLALSLGRIAVRPKILSSYQSGKFRRDGQSIVARSIDATAIIVSIVIILPPLAALIASGIPYVAFNVQAIATSLMIGGASAIVTLLLSWLLARRYNAFSHVSSIAALIVPPVVLATGWFLALRQFSDSFSLMVASITALNVLMALPFAVPVLAPQFALMNSQHDRLCAQLNVSGWNKLRLIELPMMRRSLLQAGLLAFVLSLGDLTAVTLLGSQKLLTLPSLIHQQMGHYRGNEAAGSALLLAALCYGLTLLTQILVRRDDRD